MKLKYIAYSVGAVLVVLGCCYLILLLAIGLSMPNQWYTDVEPVKIMIFPAGSIRYSESGQGQGAVLLLHGFNSQIHVWNNIWREMDGCTHAIRMDIPGFGKSIWDTNDYDLSAQADRVRQFLEAKNIKHVTLVGTSMGASLAVILAAKHPELVKSLVLMAPSGYPGSLTNPGLFGALVKNGPLNWVAVWVAKTAPYRFIFPKSIALQSLTIVTSYTEAWVNALEAVNAPVVVLWSTGDRTVPYVYSVDVMRALRDGRLVQLADSVGHSAPIHESTRIAKLICAMAPEKQHNTIAKLTPLIDQLFEPLGNQKDR